MNDWTQQQLTLWMDFACELREFIEWDLDLPPRAQEKYNAIIKKYEEGDEQ